MTKIADVLQRVSTKKQVSDDRTGLERQDKNIMDWLTTNHDYEIRRQIVLKGESAYKGRHLKGDFGLYLKELREKTLVPPDILIMDDFSRLSRLPLDVGQDLVKELARLGITIVTATDGHEYKPETQASLIGQLPILIRLEQAHADSVRKSSMIRSAKKKRRDEAIQGSKIRFGNPPKWLISESSGFSLVSHRAEAIRTIFDLINSGMSKGGVARELNKRGILGWDRKGGDTVGKWDSTKISRVVNSKAVTGTHVSRTWDRNGERSSQYMWTSEANEKGLEIKDAYPRIVSDEVWLLAQAKRSIHFQNLAKKTRASLNDGRSILVNAFCGVCGSTMRYKRSSLGERYTEYLCSSKAHGGACTTSSMNHGIAEEAVLKLLFDHVNLNAITKRSNHSSEVLKLQTQLEVVRNEVNELSIYINSKNVKGMNVTPKILIDLDMKEDQEKLLLKKLSQLENDDTSEVSITYKDIMNVNETERRVRCATFMKRFISRIEIESYKRNKKIIRIQGDEIGQIFAVIEKRTIQCFTGTW
ncbi:hypothetical protein VCHA48O428_40035 [Vibrio chagasii]|nr:hypothetical protein VCHA31O71_20085 [Vibrio chagasii]CAH6893105.1 hypothetical protein VCHA36O163_20544 [Vibrio chagasii]CAH7249411.1 hypothetical protein VCHA49P382_20085 [Vibrio chagasii]CAH7310677.1 hypothetical protein VCHA48O428_40035 [Vibrio chagasii]CAH7408422.1 hypothetical protein VCHA54O482_20543 [Vibrio chagasii]